MPRSVSVDADTGGASTTFGRAPNVADGGVVRIAPYRVNGGPLPTKATPTPTPDTEVAPVFLYRFGVILAANDAAHTALPQLPVATPHERALAQQWLQ